MLGKSLVSTFLIAVITAGPVAVAQEKAKAEPRTAVLWVDPGDIRSRDLFYGPGGQDGQPKPPFKFVGEDEKGHNPKFDVRDGQGKKWKVKLGVEARPEVVATRLMWAVGYFTNTNYFVNDLHVEGMPQQLSRGNESVDKAGEAFQARLQRKPGKNHKPWKWDDNPFKGTREFNGLRVMMALIRNWDLKADNNAWYQDKQGRAIYYVTDLGTSFGTTNKGLEDVSSKSNLESYRNTKLLSKVTPEYVDFNFPTRPPIVKVFAVPSYVRETQLRWFGEQIPRADVKWIASLLAQLSPQQIKDAFRAGGYTPEQIDAFSEILQSRIAELSKL